VLLKRFIVTKKEKKQTSKPLLKEQERINLELKSDGQEHTNEAGFQHSEETLALGGKTISTTSLNLVGTSRRAETGFQAHWKMPRTPKDSAQEVAVLV
jgi:hypothetical protein